MLKEFSFKQIISHHGFQIGIIVFLAFMVRGSYLFSSINDPTAFQPLVDSRTYHNLASDFARNGRFDQEFLWQATFYPLFLSLVYKVIGVSLMAAKLLQVLLGTLTCYLTICLGKKSFNHFSGIAAGLIVAVNGPLVFFEAQILGTGWASFWVIWISLIVFGIEMKPRKTNLFIFGFSSVLAILTRPTFIPVVLGLFVYLLLRSLKKTSFKTSSGLFFGWAVLGFLVVIIPYSSVINSQVGHLGVIPPSGGINIFIGNNSNFDSTINIRPGLSWESLLAEPQKHGAAPDPWSGQPYFQNKVKEYIFTSPLSFISLISEKTIHFLSTREFPRTYDLYLNAQWSPVLKFLVFKIGPWGFPFGIILPLAVVGLVFAGKKTPFSMFIFLATYGLSIVLVFVSSRYRTPLIPLFSVLAGYGIYTIIHVYKKRNFREIISVIMLLLLISVLGTVPGPFAQETVNIEPEIYFGVGYNHYNNKNWENAVEFFRHSLELSPNQPAVHNFLGISLANSGYIEQSVVHFHTAVELKPDYSNARNNLQTAKDKLMDHYYRVGRSQEAQNPKEALFQYELVRSIAPDWPEILVRLAWVKATTKVDSLRNGEEALALIDSQQVNEIKNNPFILLARSAALAELGRWDEAVETVTMAISMNRDVENSGLASQLHSVLVLYQEKTAIRN